MVKGFTLIETMVVVALLGIIAALAAPAFQPLIYQAELDYAAEQAASLFHQARLRAMSDRRCTRVRIENGAAPAVLIAEVLNAYDCGDSENANQHPSTAPKITAGQPTWIQFRRVQLGRKSVSADWVDNTASWTDGDISTGEAPALEDTSPDPADTGILQVRYRPTGRIHSFDTNVMDDDGLIALHHARLDKGRKAILLESHGPICILPRDVLPAGTVNQRRCP